MGLRFNKILFIDLETTGLDKEKHGVHEIAGIFQIDGVCVDAFSKQVCYHAFAEINAPSLKISGVTQAVIMRYPKMDIVFREIQSLIELHVDQTNPMDKLVLAGYNSGEMDKPFLQMWFRRNNGAAIFKSYFHSISEDIAALAINYMRKNDISPNSLKLGDVAKALGIDVNPTRLHMGDYDVEIVRLIYNIVSK